MISMHGNQETKQGMIASKWVNGQIWIEFREFNEFNWVLINVHKGPIGCGTLWVQRLRTMIMVDNFKSWLLRVIASQELISYYMGSDWKDPSNRNIEL